MELWARLQHFELSGWGLLVLTAGFVGALFLRRLLPEGRRHRGRVSVLLLGTGPLLHLLATALREGGAPTASASVHLLNMGLILLGIAGVASMLVFDIALGRSRIPTLVRDLVQVSCFGVLVAIALQSGGMHPLSLLTTSAVATAIVGLALQSVIANTFAGLVLQVERTYALGDWIQIGPRVGRITEIRWRSSTLETRDGDDALVPNLQLLSQEVVNLSRPSPSRRVTVKVPFHHRHAPGQVEAALLPALRGLPGALERPAPTCQPADFAGTTITYLVTCWARDVSWEVAVEGEVRRRIWYAAARAGLEGPCPAGVTAPSEPSETPTLPLPDDPLPPPAEAAPPRGVARLLGYFRL